MHPHRDLLNQNRLQLLKSYELLQPSGRPQTNPCQTNYCKFSSIAPGTLCMVLTARMKSHIEQFWPQKTCTKNALHCIVFFDVTRQASPLSTSKLPYLVRASCTSALDIASTQDDSHLCCHSDYPLSTKRAQTTGRQSFKVLLKLFCNSCMLFVGNEKPTPASQLSQNQPGWTVLELWKHYLTMTVQAAALGQVSGISNKNTVTKADLSSKPARQTPLASFDHLLQLSQCKKCGNVRGSLRVTWPRSGSGPVSNSDTLWLIIYDRPIYVCVYNQKNISHYTYLSIIGSKWSLLLSVNINSTVIITFTRNIVIDVLVNLCSHFNKMYLMIYLCTTYHIYIHILYIILSYYEIRILYIRVWVCSMSLYALYITISYHIYSYFISLSNAL